MSQRRSAEGSRLPARLPRSFYLREDVVAIARELLGRKLWTEFNGRRTAGIISETEAYAGPIDRASHAWNGRRTQRNEVMYGKGGTAYVYLCYGIHHLFNVVTNAHGTPHAVLIRAIVPVEGIDLMRKRRKSQDRLITGGPGTLTEALGIRTRHNGIDLVTGSIGIGGGIEVDPDRVLVGPRIGVQYAGADALLPYRFRLPPDLVASLS
jgi:DNA-3-methyladenine glycosylase